MQFEPLPEKRNVPPFVRKVSARSVVLDMMKERALEKGEFQKMLEDERKRADAVVAAVALQVYRRQAKDDPFVRGLAELLAERKVETITYAGEPLTPELELAVDILEWLPPEDNLTECVAEAIEPEIRYDGRILHRAKLSCRRAPESEPEPEVSFQAAEAQEAASEPNGAVEQPAAAADMETAEIQTVEEAELTVLAVEPEPLKKRSWAAIAGTVWDRFVSLWRRKKKRASAQAGLAEPEENDHHQEGSDPA